MIFGINNTNKVDKEIFIHVILSSLLMCLENILKRIIPTRPCYFSYNKHLGNIETLKNRRESYLHFLILASPKSLTF